MTRFDDSDKNDSGDFAKEPVMRLPMLFTAALAFLTIGQPALAQYPRYSRYQSPAGPTMPRELDYFRRDVGVLDPYNTFVAPRRRLEQNLREMDLQERADVQRTQRSLSQIRQSLAAPTGTGATFMNHSHYYRGLPGTVR